MAFKNVYLVSLYYSKEIQTGANKRFDEFARAMRRLGDVSVTLVIRSSEYSGDIHQGFATCLIDCQPSGVINRLHAYVKLGRALKLLEPGIVISDFMPIPFFGLQRHQHYQLIHDLRSATRFGRWLSARLAFSFQKDQLLRAPGIIAVSNETKKHLMENLRLPSHRIIVSHNGISDSFVNKELPASVRQVDILYVATFEERKNHVNLVLALEKYREIDPNVRIVFVGRDKGTLASVKCQIKNSGLDGNVELLEEVGGEESLIELYDSSRLFVSTSHFEGFGMPLVEARSRGCQVCCSDISVFREIMGHDAIYFDQNNPVDIFQKIRGLLCTDAEFDHRESDSFAKRFSWDVQALALYNKISARSIRSNVSGDGS